MWVEYQVSAVETLIADKDKEEDSLNLIANESSRIICKVPHGWCVAESIHIKWFSENNEKPTHIHYRIDIIRE